MQPFLIALALAIAGPAQPAPTPDPVRALEAQVMPGRGVTVSSTTRLLGDGKLFATIRADGVTGFRKGWLTDVDDTIRFHIAMAVPEALTEDFRFPTLFTRVKGVTYTSGGQLVGRLPLDKKWVRHEWPGDHPGALEVDLFRPGTLEALLATASSRSPRAAKGVIYSSKIPGSSSRLTGDRGEKVTWALWFDAKGRVTRLTTRASQQTNDNYELGISSDQRFTGWGARVTVEPPPQDLVMPESDLPEIDLLGESAEKLTEAVTKGN
ncbi:hypothetical protein ACFXJ8_01430 [Nonomuraea sp. NPDC059194]|uniref:hypothetical protein n=1 Tax=Nonomuraea sp. NPDC059194 TaxID=3346764 RepID=UPI0036A58813